MAHSLTRTGAIATLEDAVHLLRHAPAATLLCHFAGSAPFALGFLFYWNAVTNPRTSGTTIVAGSLMLATLLVWMNCCRAIFAGRLRSVLDGSQDSPWNVEPWSAARAGRLLSDQSLLGATRLLAIPFAVLILFPLADVVAFYRYSAVIPIGKARKLASVDTGQNWTLLLIVQFLWLVAALNVGVTLAALPQLARILTGYESGFSRSGVYYISNPLFFMMVFVVTWMVFDPFLQAAYTVRCFRLESLETGDDLRAGIRRIRAAARVAAIFLLVLMPAAAIPREKLKESIEHTMQSPEYDWRLPPETRQGGKSWLVEVTDRMLVHVRGFFETIGRGIGEIIRWLERQFGGGGPTPVGGAPPRSLNWSIYLLTFAALAVAAWLVWRAWTRLRKAEPAAADAVTPVALDAEDLSPARLPEEQWLELAAQCLRDGDYRLAMRAFYLANLAWLGRREFLTLHSGKTNREYQQELARRGREFPAARALFSANVAVFERGWYGTRAVSSDDVAEFQGRVSEMKRLMQENAEIAA